MLARSNIITHPSGVTFKTPLLIPSFSSRGFPFLDRQFPEVHEHILTYKDFLPESLLISAYDLHYGHIPAPNEFANTTPIIFIDSGGYEKYHSTDFLGESKFHLPDKEWNGDLLRGALERWPNEYPAIIVNFDGNAHDGSPLIWEHQLSHATEQFIHFPQHLHNFLIKPEPKEEIIPIEKIVTNSALLKDFDIVGFTEKELGKSILSRMVNINRIREALDSANVTAPIHVFGSLDPITSVLYFIAGAEIFDGLTWLKYSYYLNSAIYTPNYGALVEGIGIDELVNESISRKNNIYYLNDLKESMLDYFKTGSFNEFEKFSHGNGTFLENCYSEFTKHINK
jgi:hypothetical protein